MKRWIVWLGACSVVALVLSFASPSTDRVSSASSSMARDPWISLYQEDFAHTAADAVPAGWKVGETNGAGKTAVWAVAHEVDAAGNAGEDLVRVRTENAGKTYNVLLTEATFPPSLRMSVRLRADAGTEDQGGGLVWHARDADNYMITRWNPLEDNLRIYRVTEGVRTQLNSMSFAADPRAWHHLEVIVQRGGTRVSFDGRAVLQLETPPSESPGRVGLWTKADASTSFTSFFLKALE